MKSKSKWTEQRDLFFMNKFGIYFKEWKAKDKKNTQGEFARQICAIRSKKTGEKCPVTNGYVSDWLHGRWFPNEYLPEIAEVLGIKEEDLLPHTHDDLYELSSEYMTNLGDTKIKTFCDEAGLDLHFLYAVRKLFGDEFSECFPFWTPIGRTSGRLTDILDNMCSHMDLSCLSKSAPMDNGNDIFQAEVEIEKNGNTEKRIITMSEQDILLLRDIQKDVKDFIRYRFFARREEMKREGQEASRRAWKPLKGGGKGFVGLTASDLNEIDRYFHGYVDKDSKKQG